MGKLSKIVPAFSDFPPISFQFHAFLIHFPKSLWQFLTIPHFPPSPPPLSPHPPIFRFSPHFPSFFHFPHFSKPLRLRLQLARKPVRGFATPCSIFVPLSECLFCFGAYDERMGGCCTKQSVQGDNDDPFYINSTPPPSQTPPQTVSPTLPPAGFVMSPYSSAGQTPYASSRTGRDFSCPTSPRDDGYLASARPPPIAHLPPGVVIPLLDFSRLPHLQHQYRSPYVSHSVHHTHHNSHHPAAKVSHTHGVHPGLTIVATMQPDGFGRQLD